MSHYDDTPADCTICGEWAHTHENGAFDGHCTPFMVAVVTDDREHAVFQHDYAGIFPYCYRLAGGWMMAFPGDQLPEEADAWGIPLLWDSEPVLPNCDRVMRLVLAVTPNHSHTPIRGYDAWDLEHYAGQWARKLGLRVVVTGQDGGKAVDR